MPPPPRRPGRGQPPAGRRARLACDGPRDRHDSTTARRHDGTTGGATSNLVRWRNTGASLGRVREQPQAPGAHRHGDPTGPAFRSVTATSSTWTPPRTRRASATSPSVAASRGSKARNGAERPTLGGRSKPPSQSASGQGWVTRGGGVRVHEECICKLVWSGNTAVRTPDARHVEGQSQARRSPRAPLRGPRRASPPTLRGASQARGSANTRAPTGAVGPPPPLRAPAHRSGSTSMVNSASCESRCTSDGKPSVSGTPK